MNTTLIKNQYKLAGKGPVDAKALVKTYSELCLLSTWEVVDEYGKTVNTAYNGMVVAVWLDPDTSKNGIYFFQDNNKRNVSSVLNNNPDVTKEANWHRLGDTTDVTALMEQLTALAERLDALENKTTEVFENRLAFPSTGVEKKLYIDASTNTMYFWNGSTYVSLAVSSAGTAYDIISGGDANG